MLASEVPIPMTDPAILAQRLPPRAAADFVEWNPTHTPAEMFSTILRTEQQITRLAGLRPATPPIDDDRPINEYFFLRRLSGPFP
jgi:hypothetical protein